MASLFSWDKLKNAASATYHGLAPSFIDGGQGWTSAKPQAPQQPASVVNDIQTAKYGVLANNPQAQQQFLNNNRPVQFNPVNAALTSAIQSPQNLINNVDHYANQSAFGRGLQTTALAGLRSAVGTAQGLSGLYDLATPGIGTNRFSKTLNNFAPTIDQTAKAEGANPLLYHGAQAGTDLLTFATPGAVLKGLGEVPRVAKVVSPIVKASTGLEGLVGKSVAPLAEKGLGGRIAARSIQNIAKPGYPAANATFTGLQAGKEASTGQKVTPLGVGTNLAIGGVGFPVAGAIGKELTAPITNKVMSSLRNAKLAPPSSLKPNELADISKMRQVSGTGASMGQTDLFNRASAALKKANINPNDGTAIDRLLGAHRTYDTRVQARKQVLNNAKGKLKPLGLGQETGSVPAGAFDPLGLTGKGENVNKGVGETFKPNASPEEVQVNHNIEVRQYGAGGLTDNTVTKGKVIRIQRSKAGETLGGTKMAGLPEGNQIVAHIQTPEGSIKRVTIKEPGDRQTWIGIGETPPTPVSAVGENVNKPTGNAKGLPNSRPGIPKVEKVPQGQTLQRDNGTVQIKSQASIKPPELPQSTQGVVSPGVSKTSDKSNTKLAPRDQQPVVSQELKIKNQESAQSSSLVTNNTTNGLKQRGFTTSVKNSPEVSPTVQKQSKGAYKERNTAQMAIKADSYSRGDLTKVTQETHDVIAKKTGTLSDQEIANSIAVAKQLDAKGQHEQATQIYDRLAEHGTKGGQAIQAFSLLRNRTPEGVKYQAIKTFKKAGVKLTSQDEKKLNGLLGELSKTKPNTDARDMALHGVVDFVDRRIPTKLGDKIVNFWRAGLLTSPVTTAGNILGNTTEAATRNLYSNPVAVGVDKFFSVFTGKRTKTLVGGQTSGAIKGGQKGLTYLKTGFDARRAPNLKLDAPRRVNYKNKVLDNYVNGVYKSLGAQDQPFYYAAEKQTLRDLATADAKNLKLTGQAKADYIANAEANPDFKPQTFKTKSTAEKAAKYAVYQNDTLLGRMAGGLKKYASEHSDAGGAVANFLLPFSQVPASVATRIIDRTPIGIAREIVSQAKNKSFDQRAMSEAIGNGTFGVGVFAAGAALAKTGDITGAYPTDQKEQQLWKSEGKQAYSVKVGNRWYSLNYMQPFGTILSIGGQYQKDLNEGKTASEAWNKAGATALNSVESQSFLQGINGILSAINDPNRSATSYVNSTVSSTIPNFIRAAARATDPLQRDTKQLGNAVKGAIPGLRETVPAKQDMFGKPLQATDNAINQYTNPLRPSLVRNSNDPLVKELRNLQDSQNGIIPTQFDKNSIQGAKLSDQQVRDLNSQVNGKVQDTWNTIIKDSRYQALSPEERATVLKKAKDNIANTEKANFAKANNIQTTAKAVSSNSNYFSTTSSKTDYYSSPDAEYKAALTKYQQDKQSGKINDIQDIKAQQSLNKLKIGSKYDKNVRDLYSLSKAQIYSYVSSNKNGQKLADQLIAYDKALNDAGLTAYLKFKTGIAPSTKKSSGKKSSGKTASKASLNTILSTLKSTNAAIKPPTAPSSPNITVKTTKLPSSYKRTALKKYTVSKPKTTA